MQGQQATPSPSRGTYLTPQLRNTAGDNVHLVTFLHERSVCTQLDTELSQHGPSVPKRVHHFYLYNISLHKSNPWCIRPSLRSLKYRKLSIGRALLDFHLGR